MCGWEEEEERQEEKRERGKKGREKEEERRREMRFEFHPVLQKALVSNGISSRRDQRATAAADQHHFVQIKKSNDKLLFLFFL